MEFTKTYFVDYRVGVLPFGHDIVNDNYFYPMLLVLEGSNGECSHAVSKVSNWIFDSTLDEAIVLCRENLDWCVSSDIHRATFVKVHWGIVILPKLPTPRTLLLLKPINKNSIHCALSTFFMLLDEVVVADEILKLAPKSENKENVYNGLFTGAIFKNKVLLHSNTTLKKIQIKK